VDTSINRGKEIQFAERGCCSRTDYSNNLEPCSLPLFLAAAATNSTGEAAMYVILAKFSNFFTLFTASNLEELTYIYNAP